VTPVLSPVETFGAKRARLWGKVKAEARHYWLGTKLLSREVRLAYRLCMQIARGHEMSRRERKQLLRTSADLVRMVPFIVILVVPFAEFALPVLLKVFPNMLPSTYLDSTGREAKLQKQLLVKMEMARFLQETTHMLAQQIADQHPAKVGPDGKPLTEAETAANARSFRDFMAKVRKGQKVRNADILAFTKLFDSELTLDNLDKKQLEAMCRLLDIKVFGGEWVLRHKLEQRLLAIQKDDQLIKKDGLDALNEAELAEACRARGIFTGKDAKYLKRKLADWLELSLEHKVPIALLLLSRAFSRQMTGAHDAGLVESSHPEPSAAVSGESGADAEAGVDPELAEALAKTLAHVPEVAVADAEKEIADRSDDREARLQLLEEEDVTAAFEELQASKKGGDGKSRAAKLRSMKPAVGVTAEKLARLEATNDVVENIIDTTIAMEAQENPVTAATGAGATATAAGAEPAPAVPAPADATPAAAVASLKVAEQAAVSQATAATAPQPQQQPAAGPVAAVAAAVADLTATATATVTGISPPATPSAAPTAAASAPAAAPATPATAVPSASSAESDEAAAALLLKKKQKVKTIATVDKLNDSVGAMIDAIKAQAENLEKEHKEKAQQATHEHVQEVQQQKEQEQKK